MYVLILLGQLRAYVDRLMNPPIKKQEISLSICETRIFRRKFMHFIADSHCFLPELGIAVSEILFTCSLLKNIIKNLG
jgi:hypothetical protein